MNYGLWSTKYDGQNALKNYAYLSFKIVLA